jgi:hypothetical protein
MVLQRMRRQTGPSRTLGIAATALLLAMTTSPGSLAASDSTEAEAEPQNLTIGMWPGLVDQFETYAGSTPGVQRLGGSRAAGPG